MGDIRKFLVILACGFLFAGCESIDSLWPSLTGDDPAGSGTKVPIPPSRAEKSGAPTLGPTTARPRAARPARPAVPRAAVPSRPATATVSPTGNTGTFVGNKVQAMRGDLVKLETAITGLNERMRQARTSTVGASRLYHGIVAQMTSKLQSGTTPGHPQLLKQWGEAQNQIKGIEANISNMNNLSNDVDSQAAMAGYLLDSVRATYTLSGAVDADHERLRALEDDVNRTIVLIDRLLNELSSDVNRQTTYVDLERRNLTTLSLAIKNGELYGASLASRAFAQTQILQSAQNGGGPRPGDRPLVIIKFDRPNVPYQQALYNAVSRALERKPDATFDLVAVSPQKGSPARVALNRTAAKRNAQGVLRALSDMGLPNNRIRLSETTSPEADNNEVRLFVR